MASGCGGDPDGDQLASHCHPPAHQDQLLAAYQADPVFAVRPPEAVAVGGPVVEEACHQLTTGSLHNGRSVTGVVGATAAKVSLSFALNLNFTPDQLTGMYDPGIRSRGWTPQPLDLPPLSTGEQQAGLYYCKEFNGVPSFLLVSEHWIATSTGRASVDVSPSPTGGWPEAGSIDINITAIRGISCAPA
jgi:hypothetical protein